MTLAFCLPGLRKTDYGKIAKGRALMGYGPASHRPGFGWGFVVFKEQ